jgi:hypothetical protein
MRPRGPLPARSCVRKGPRTLRIHRRSIASRASHDQESARSARNAIQAYRNPDGPLRSRPTRSCVPPPVPLRGSGRKRRAHPDRARSTPMYFRLSLCRSCARVERNGPTRRRRSRSRDQRQQSGTRCGVVIDLNRPLDPSTLSHSACRRMSGPVHGSSCCRTGTSDCATPATPRTSQAGFSSA